MRKLQAIFFRLLVDRKGQDLIEYALMAGFVAVAAGAVLPSATTEISEIFSKVSSVLSTSIATGI
jgi:pilus assembly protein Flp/PilA